MREIEKLQDTPTSIAYRDPSNLDMRSEVLDAVPEEIPHLRDYWNVILKRRWVVLSSLLIVLGTVLIGTLKQKPTYRGTVLLEIGPEEPNILDFNQVLQINAINVDSYLQTRYRLLQSRSLAERVVRRLELYRRPEFYKAKALFGFVERDPDPVPSRNTNEEIQTIQEAYGNSIKNFLDRIGISPVRGSNLVEASFDSQDPAMAARIANQLASEFIEQNLDVKWEATEKASEWLSRRLGGLKAKLENTEDALQSYAQRNSILFVTEKQDLANARLEQLQEKFTKAQAARYQKESISKLLQENTLESIPGALSNRLIQDLTTQIAELRREYAELTSILKPDYPRVVKVQKQIDTMESILAGQKAILAQNVIDEYQAAFNRQEFLEEALEEQKRVVNEIANKSIQYKILLREVETNRQLYYGVLQRLKEAQLSAGLKATNIRIVDPAEVPGSPIKPRVLLNLGLALVLGTTLGVGLAFFQDYLDDTLKTPDEVEHHLRLPALGVIPRFQVNGLEKRSQKLLAATKDAAQPALVLRSRDDVALAEAYRSLRTSILLSGSPAPRCVLVTSALPGEGKTTTVVNLGAAFASLGMKKVVILDCDLRRPSCHQATGVSNVPGLVNCLTGQMELKEVIKEVPGVPSLYIIASGPLPPNPTELLSSPKLGELLQRIRSEFEFVLIDSPPLLNVADGRVLATHADGAVLVVQGNSTPREAVRDARTLLAGANGHILGVTLNNLNLTRGGYDLTEILYQSQ